MLKKEPGVAGTGVVCLGFQTHGLDGREIRRQTLGLWRRPAIQTDQTPNVFGSHRHDGRLPKPWQIRIPTG